MKRLFILLIFICTVAPLTAGGGKEDPQTITISGTLSVKGNEPFSFLAIRDKNGTVYKLEGPVAAELRRIRGKGPVTVSGVISDDEIPVGVQAVIELRSYSF